jgi:hypothetical protein
VTAFPAAVLKRFQDDGAGLGVTLAIGNALDEVWAVPRVGPADFVSSRLRGLAVLAVVGTANVASTAVVTLARNGTIQPPLAGIASLSASVAVGFLVYLACSPPRG